MNLAADWNHVNHSVSTVLHCWIINIEYPYINCFSVYKQDEIRHECYLISLLRTEIDHGGRSCLIYQLNHLVIHGCSNPNIEQYWHREDRERNIYCHVKHHIKGVSITAYLVFWITYPRNSPGCSETTSTISISACSDNVTDKLINCELSDLKRMVTFTFNNTNSRSSLTCLILKQVTLVNIIHTYLHRRAF